MEGPALDPRRCGSARRKVAAATIVAATMSGAVGGLTSSCAATDAGSNVPPPVEGASASPASPGSASAAASPAGSGPASAAVSPTTAPVAAPSALGPPRAPSPAVACPSCDEPEALATISEPALVELSGIVASHDHPGVYYVHNDSGDTARFFAIDEKGADQGTFNVTNAKAEDWEDIARGPCADPAKSCIYLADIGDNKSKRGLYTIYRVDEPATLGAGEHSVQAEVFSFVYPDGPHNAETLLVHPKTGEVTVVTKSLMGSAAYTYPLPLKANATVALTKVGDVDVPELLGLVTAGDVRPDGKAILLRTYAFAYFYAVPAGASLADSLVEAPCRVPAPSEPQGEGIGFLASGKGYVTVSEGKAEPLHEVSCP